MFNQVKLNVPLLDAIQQVPAYTKFLKDMRTEKRKMNVPKKVFLATNIRRTSVWSHFGQIQRSQMSHNFLYHRTKKKLVEHFLTWEQVSTYYLFQYTNNLGWASCVQLGNHSVSWSICESSQRGNHRCPYSVGDFIYPVDFIVLET